MVANEQKADIRKVSILSILVVLLTLSVVVFSVNNSEDEVSAVDPIITTIDVEGVGQMGFALGYDIERYYNSSNSRWEFRYIESPGNAVVASDNSNKSNWNLDVENLVIPSSVT